MRIDLNADVGEGGAGRPLLDDRALMPHITSANVACGFHAGDAQTMHATVVLASEFGVAVGAHPSFPDRDGFGRVERQASPTDVEGWVVQQIESLAAIAVREGVRLAHVKPHGALYNMAARDVDLAEAVVRAVAAVDRSLTLVGLVGSALVAAGRRAGLATASEAFADRGYLPDGRLVTRGEPGAVLIDEALVAARATTLARDRTIIAIDGAPLPVEVDTICVHGDTPGAAALARAIRTALANAGVEVRALGRT